MLTNTTPHLSANPGPQSSQSSQIKAAVRIVQKLLSSFPGAVALKLWNGASYAVGQTAPLFTLVLRDPAVLRQLVFSKRNPIPLADAYFRGLLDVEGDFYAALKLKAHFQKLTLTTRERATLVLDALRLPRFFLPTGTSKASTPNAASFTHHHTKRSDSAAISFHYDVSNAFYKLWLDEQMVYSCAYFETPTDTLEQAQRNKLDHVCRKLRLQPGERFLDIGCGWGAMVCWAAQHYGVQAHGITLSQKQFDYATERVARLGLQDLVKIEMRDYRDLEGEAVYDKISSIGMLEHVGLAKLPVYNATVMRVLRPGGLFLNHGITHDEEGWHPTVDSKFINRYVFPDGELDTVSNIMRGMEHAHFEIHDVENLRAHYALTLREWVKRLEARHEEALQFVNEDAYRIWRFYMAACAIEFEAEGTAIYQILASKRGSGTLPVPLNRGDLYAKPHPRTVAIASSVLLTAALLANAPVHAASYEIDPAHTFATFEIAHFATSTTRGRFDKKEGTLQFDRAAKTGKIDMTIYTGSINTGIPVFDKFLTGFSLFDSATFPTARFVANKFNFDGDKVTDVSGSFTLLGKTNPVTLKATNFSCYSHPLLKREVCGGDFETILDRSQYGMNYGLIFGFSKDVRLVVQVEAIKQP